MILDRHGLPLAPSWGRSCATRTGTLRELRARRKKWAPALLEAARYYCDWQLVRELCEEGIQREGELAEHYGVLGQALLRLGEEEGAWCCSIRAALLEPAEVNGRQLLWELYQWEPRRRALPAVPQAFRSTGRLRLELLAPHHWQDLVWQYSDPEIARLCCWPEFRDYEHWRQWLEQEYALGDVLPFAVLDSTWGFCGVVALIQHQHSGFVYYWLGPEFRGQGRATEAIGCVLALAHERWGLRCCYAKVFEFNAPSRRVLERLGFERQRWIPSVLPQDELIYRLGPAQNAAETYQELTRLLRESNRQLRVPPPLIT